MPRTAVLPPARSIAGTKKRVHISYLWIELPRQMPMNGQMQKRLEAARNTSVGKRATSASMTIRAFFDLAYAQYEPAAPRREIEDSYIAFIESRGKDVPPPLSEAVQTPLQDLFPPCTCGGAIKSARFVKVQGEDERTFYCSAHCFLRENDCPQVAAPKKQSERKRRREADRKRAEPNQVTQQRRERRASQVHTAPPEVQEQTLPPIEVDKDGFVKGSWNP